MNADQLRQRLQQLSLEESGSMDSCRRRLKSHYRNEAMSKVYKRTVTYHYDMICIVDFEATCDSQTNPQPIQEIIEFPAIMVDVKQKQIVSTFHEFVKPKCTEKLSDFCVDLTAISQEVVDKSDTFAHVLDKFENWFHGFIDDNDVKSFALATDGPCDMSHFFAQTCKLYDIPYPSYAKRWINIRKLFVSQYKNYKLSLDEMLTHLGMQFKGRQHSGYDDALNIANLLIRMIIDGANPVINERISWHHSERKCLADLRCGFVRVFYNKSSDGLNLSDSDDSISEAISEELNEEKRIRRSAK